MEIIFELDTINKAARRFLEATGDSKLFAFSGELGAGKTTFIHALCKEFGVTDPVSSPTYSIIQEYATLHRSIIYHIDLYRIKNREEALEAGIEDCLNSNEICMVEWPGKVPGIFPDETVFTQINTLSVLQRKMIVTIP